MTTMTKQKIVRMTEQGRDNLVEFLAEQNEQRLKQAEREKDMTDERSTPNEV